MLALIVVGPDTADWHVMSHTGTTLTRSAYYLPLLGLPATMNESKVRLKVPLTNLLTAVAMKHLMDAQAARWAS